MLSLSEREENLKSLPLSDSEDSLVILMFRLAEIEIVGFGKLSASSLKTLEWHEKRLAAKYAEETLSQPDGNGH